MIQGQKHQASTGCRNKKDAAIVERDARKAVIITSKKRKNLSARMTVDDGVIKMIEEEYAHTKDAARSISKLKEGVSYLPKTRKYLDQVERDDLIKIRDTFLANGLKPQTANRKLAPIRKMLKMAANEWQVSSPINAPKDLKFSTHKRRIMEYAEEEVLLDYFRRIIHDGYVPEGYAYKKLASVKAYQAMFIVYLETGMRLSELTELEKDDIYWLGRYLRIKDPKNSVERDIPVTERCEDALKILIELFPKGKQVVPYGPDNVSANMNSHFRDAGLKDMTVHCLRHTFITRRISEGVPTIVVKELAGHKSVATTEKYAKVSMQTMQMAVGNGSETRSESCSGKCSEKKTPFWLSTQNPLHPGGENVQ